MCCKLEACAMACLSPQDERYQLAAGVLGCSGQKVAHKIADRRTRNPCMKKREAGDAADREVHDWHAECIVAVNDKVFS